MRIFIISIMIMAGMVCCGVNGSTSSDEEQILRLQEEWAKALEMEDRDALKRILATEFTFIEPDGTVVHRDQYLQDRGNNPYQIESFELADVQVRVYGNSALVFGLAIINERLSKTRYHYQLRWKELWLKSNSNWQVLAGQATPVNPKWNHPFIIP